MGRAELRVALNSDEAQVKVIGRASFEDSEDLKSFCMQILDKKQSKVLSINLKECLAMDSTFMGILAMISLSAKQNSIPVNIVRCSSTAKKLLCELGLETMFNFVDDPKQAVDWDEIAKTREMSREDHSRNVLDAHQTLIDVNEDNREKFQDIITFLKNPPA